MPKEYIAGEQLPAADANAIVKVAGLYAASSAGNDTYAITVSPAPDSYATGDVWRFKADVANTGAATLNVNGLGAKTIKKNVTEDLVTNDIKANEIVEVIYDGTNFQLVTHSRLLGNYISSGSGDNSTPVAVPAGTKMVIVTAGGAVSAGSGNSVRGQCILMEQGMVSQQLAFGEQNASSSTASFTIEWTSSQIVASGLSNMSQVTFTAYFYA